jgi:uncharacterized sodium:solute symporter family permease YidK
MATQASAITFLSIPGQGFESGIGFVQNYFGLPLALIIVCTGLLVVIYTVTGGSETVNLIQKWQMAMIFGGMVTALVVLLAKLPEGLGFSGAAHIAAALGKLQAVDFSLDASRRYTLWSGLLGGLYLSLSYFGTDQSQVQRYIGGASLREGRLGLMFNAVLKIPMQFLILLLGALLFVFYQFFRRVGGSAVFFAAVAAQALVIAMFFSLNIGYLWYNLIGCAACIAFSLLLQMVLGPRAASDAGRAA